jgi:peptide/nickel transport system substrate-binding protein
MRVLLKVWVLAVVLASAVPLEAATIRIARGALPPSLGVPFTAVGQPSSEIWIAMFDALTRIDPKGVVQPGLALSWSNPAPRTWRFELRPGVTFHDGSPCNAEAIIATLDLLRRPASSKFYVSSEVKNITALRRIDDLILEIETREPDAVLPRRMSMIFIVSPVAWAKLGEDGFAQNPSGTGSFKLADWGRGSAVTKFVAFKESWRAPKVDAIDLYTVVEPVRRVQALLSGQIDVAARLGPDELRQLPEQGFAVRALEKSQVMALTFRLVGNEKSPITDVRVRKALAMSVDREGLVRSVFDGRVTPANQGAAPVTYGYNPLIAPIPFDPTQAKALLAEAGHAKGFKLRISVFLGQLASDELIYQQVAQSIRSLGIDVELRSISYAQWLQSYVTSEWGDTDLFGWVWDSGSTYDAARPIETASCVKDHPFNCDPSIVPAIRTIASEMDPTKRLPQLQSLVAQMREAYPAIWIINVADTYVASDKVKGLDVWHMGIQYENLSLE